jgi:hypothetical protein
MAIPVLIIGRSGSGKTYSLKKFKSDEVGVISVEKGRLPFRSDIKVMKVPKDPTEGAAKDAASVNAAKYACMSEKRNIVLSMAIAGGLAALGASLYYLNGGAELAWNTYSKLPDTGFNGIPVALLASNNPLGVVFSSVFLRFIDKGGYNLAGFTAYNEYVSDLIIAVIIYFAGFAKLIGELLSRRKKSKAVGNAKQGKEEANK